MNNRRYLIKTLFCSTVSIIYPIVSLIGRSKEESITKVLFSIFGSVYSSDNNVLIIVLTMIPLFCYGFIFADFLIDDIYSACSYIFTRINYRGKWVLKKFIKLFGFILLGNFLTFIVMCLLLILLGIDQDINYIFNCFTIPLLSSLTIYVFLLTVNILSLFFSQIKTFLICLSVHIFIIIIFVYAKLQTNFWIFIFPPIQGVFSWHNTSSILPTIENQSSNLQFSLLYSFIYLILCALFELYFTFKIIKNYDFIGLVED